MVAVNPIDSTVEEFVEYSIELCVPTEGEQSEAMSHRNRTTGPVAVVKIDHLNTKFGALGNVQFWAALELGRSSGFDQMDAGREISP